MWDGMRNAETGLDWKCCVGIRDAGQCRYRVRGGGDEGVGHEIGTRGCCYT